MQLTDKGIKGLVNWIVKQYPGIPKEAVLVWVTNLNEGLGLASSGKEAAVRMQAQKLLGEALGVAKAEPGRGSLPKPEKDSPSFTVPGI